MLLSRQAAGASCQNFSGSGSGAAIGVGPALRIAPVARIPFYVAEFEAGWRVVESGMRVTANSLTGGVETDVSEFMRRLRPAKSRWVSYLLGSVERGGSAGNVTGGL